MTASESKARLKGLFNITVTPFTPDGGIDFHGLAEGIERLLAMDFDGFLIGGTYGEFATMSTEERATLFRHAVPLRGRSCPRSRADIALQRPFRSPGRA
jgi:dihydrodipicolinate synthase/N-acetylneuraminate lyase